MTVGRDVRSFGDGVSGSTGGKGVLYGLKVYVVDFPIVDRLVPEGLGKVNLVDVECPTIYNTCNGDRFPGRID